MLKLKQISIVKVNELLNSLKSQRADLLEDKAYMLSHYEFDCAQDEFEYDCVTQEIEELEKAIDNLINIIDSPDTFTDGDMMYYPVEDEF